ncbi:MAG: ComEA family DNA-binding protein [Bacteroidota bacterium]
MWKKFLYWMKLSFGFSRRESTGYILLMPFLLFLVFAPKVMNKLAKIEVDVQDQFLKNRIDSLQGAGFFKVEPKGLLFNPVDTAKKSYSERMGSIQKIPFSESDSVTLQIVPGIGPALAARIVKYRENIGGFHSEMQLEEIFGLKPEVVEKLWEFFEFDPGIYKKLAINELDVADLAKHPYIGYGEAKVIVAFRKQHGNYSGSEDLLKIKIFKSEWIKKLEPYLEF